MTIEAMQANLRDLNLYTADIDGDLGPRTYQGLADYITDGGAPDEIGRQLAHWLPVGDIETRPRIIAFLAHATHESGLKPIAENLNYSVEGLTSNFGPSRISPADAKKYGRIPGRAANREAIANTIYGGPWGKRNLGNLNWGDGWAHRGMGLMQNTGRTSQREAGKVVDMDFENHPELMLTLEGAVASAVGFWVWKGLNAIVDMPGDTTTAETKAINGGAKGKAERAALKARLRQIWL